MSNQKLELSDATPTAPPTRDVHQDAAKASSVSESQEEGTITDEGRYPNSGDMFVGNGDFGEIERDDINVEGKPNRNLNPSKSAPCITVYSSRFLSCD